jgi:L-ascorbate metabolism protein UlaG (beta-lactamase superfamily)
MKISRVCLLILSALTLFCPSVFAAKTQLEYYGHSAFKLTMPSGKVLLIDPWITNPKNPTGNADVAALKHVDYILITHGHFDHVGDSVLIAKATGAKLVCTGDLGTALVDYAGYPKSQSGAETEGNFGGQVILAGGEVTVSFIPAIHSSAIPYHEEQASGIEMDGQRYAGNPGGFLITVRGGPTIYHTGDTDLFSDMALVREYHKVDVMLCCIGGHYTMGPSRAALAVRLVKPTIVVPMHYGTFPILNGTPEEFKAALNANHNPARMVVMHVHQVLKL